jgi:hypothetical protein
MAQSTTLTSSWSTTSWNLSHHFKMSPSPPRKSSFSIPPILTSILSFDGPTGEALGLFNKYYDDSQTLTDSVLQLAQRIALFPRVALNETKSVLSYLNPPSNAFNLDFNTFYEIEQFPEEQANVQKFIELSDNQTANNFELGLGESIMALYGLWNGSVFG